MNLELKERIQSSIIISLIFISCFFTYKYLWLIVVFLCCSWSFVEWQNIIKKIKIQNLLFKKLILILSFFYIIYSGIIFYRLNDEKYLAILLLSICIFSDIGGYVFGKLIGGKKLTKISPNKTVSGSIGSFIFSYSSYFAISFIYSYFYNQNNKENLLIFLPLVLSTINQLGDLFISYFKRMAKIKNTSELIPGHGGLLDRIDGIIFAIPLTVPIIDLFL